MTIANQNSRILYAGNGVTNDFAVPFPFHAVTDLVVKEIVIATGEESLLVLNSDYVVTGSQNALGHYPNGGTVVTAAPLPDTVRLVIYRDPAQIQGLDLLDLDRFPAEAVEAQFDYLTMLVQRVSSLITRSLRQPDGDEFEIGRVPPAADRALTFAAYDANGDPIAAAGTSANLGPVTPYIDTLLAAPNAAAARAILLVGQPLPWVRNLKGVRNATTTRYDLQADYVCLTKVNGSEQEGVVLRFPTFAVPITIDATVEGVNGRDQGGAFNNPSFVHLYFIRNGETLAGLASIAEPINGPFLPSGYTHWAYATTIRYTTEFQDAAANGRTVRHAVTLVGSSLTQTSLTFVNMVSSHISPALATSRLCEADLTGTSTGGGALNMLLIIAPTTAGTEKPALRLLLALSGINTQVQQIRSGIFSVESMTDGVVYPLAVTNGTGGSGSISTVGYTVPNGDV
jgi:hypothetical protein